MRLANERRRGSNWIDSQRGAGVVRKLLVGGGSDTGIGATSAGEKVMAGRVLRLHSWNSNDSICLFFFWSACLTDLL